jgi:hypothetical protein
MQRVIHLIEALNGAGIPVPPFPYVEPLAATPLGQPAPSEEDLQIRMDAYEVRVEAWRQEVITLHRLHFPSGSPPATN